MSLSPQPISEESKKFEKQIVEIEDTEKKDKPIRRQMSRTMTRTDYKGLVKKISTMTKE